MEKDGNVAESYELTKNGAANTGDAQEGRKRDDWKEVCVTFFREEASLHGIRYVFLRSSWFCRRFIWLCILLMAITIFIYLNTLNLMKYLSHPQKISIDVSVQSRMTFPAVTICNYNKHRFTKVAELGLFDAMYTQSERKLTSQPVGRFWYVYRSDVCIYDKDEFYKVLKCETSMAEETCLGRDQQFKGVSSLVCEELCSETVSENDVYCAGFWYNRTSLTCYLTPNILEENAASPSDQSAECRKESLEFYEKRLIKKSPSFVCKFDENDCAEHLQYYEPPKKNVKETFVVAKATKELNDYTGSLSFRGRYLSLFETKRRPGYMAQFDTKMNMLENSCVEFYYRFLGQGNTTVTVAFMDKYKFEAIIEMFSGKAQTEWQRFFAKLPDGPGKVFVKANRLEEPVTTGLVIDNFGIISCDLYKVDCLRDKRGLTYEGNRSVTKSGKRCVAVDGEEPFCRNPDNDDMPWCYVGIDEEDYHYRESCDIPWCACSEGEFLCYDSGGCIPTYMTCDAKVDCEYYEDEVQNCESKASLACEFDDEYICGYNDLNGVKLSWRWKNALEIHTPNGPKADRKDRRDGYFLYVDTLAAEEGNSVDLISPPFKLQHDACISFFMRSFSQYSRHTRLFVYLSYDDPLGNFPRELIREFDLTGDANAKWKPYTIHLPPSEQDRNFYLTWTYQMGLPEYSNLALDSIGMQGCTGSSSPDITLTQMKDTFICDFTEPDLCELRFRDRGWHWAPYNVEEYAFDPSITQFSECTTNYALKGTFRTPGFPKEHPYPTSCLGKIKGPEGVKIKLTFFNRKFAMSDNCTEEYLKIKIGNGRELVLCGFEKQADDTTLPLSVSEIELVARGRIAFQGSYELIGNKRYAIIMNNYAALQTWALRFMDVHCLTLDIVAAEQEARLHINLAGFDYIGLYKENAKTTLRKTIPAGFYMVKILTEGSGERINAVIRDMKIELGWCPMLYETGSINCDFNDRSNCGYLDFSHGKLKWERNSDGMVVKPVYRTTAGKANLVSPTFTTDKMSCLRISISSSSGTRLQMSVFGSSDIFDKSNATFFDVYLNGTKEQKITITISHNAKRVMWSTEKENILVTLHSVRLLSDLMACTDTIGVTKRQDPVDSGVQNAMVDLSSKLGIEAKASTSPPPVVNISRTIQETLLSETIVEEGAHFRRDFTAYFNVGDLNEATAHQLEDMVFSCKFNGEDCDMEMDFIAQRTKYGICYTFNSGQNSTAKKTTIPGSEHGLRLVVNTEAYESMKGLKMDDGIKIHIHRHDEIPYVQYVGKAAAVSHHTYFEISHEDVESMEPPYGKCGSKELSLYPNQTYTRYRCNRQCETKAWLKECGCIDHYMPGDGRYCTPPERKLCQEKIDMSEVFSCECPTSCFSIVYASQSSSSILAYYGLGEYLSKMDKIRRITDQLEYSRILQHRMFPHRFMEFRHLLNDVEMMIMGLLTYIEEQSITKEASEFSLIQRSLLEFHHMANEDLHMLKVVLEKLIEGAECITRLNGVLKSSIEETLNNLAYLKVLFSSGTSSVSISNYAENDRKQMVVAKTRQIAELFITFSDVNFAWCHQGQLNHLLPSERMMSLKKHFTGIDAEAIQKDSVTRAKIIRALNVIIPTDDVTLEQYTSNDTIRGAINQLYNYVHINFTALLVDNSHYTSNLDSAMGIVSADLTHQYANLTHSDDKAELRIIKEGNDLRQAFKSAVSDDVRNEKNIIKEARKLSRDHFEKMIDVMRKTQAMMQKRVLEGLNTEIHQRGPDSTLSSYWKALSAISRIYPYMLDSFKKNLTDIVRSMRIWRKPSANIDSDDYIDYDITSDLALRDMWPSTLDFSGFYTIKAKSILKTNIGRFYRQLGNELYELEKSSAKYIEEFEGIYLAINKTLKNVLESVEVNEAFLLKNFLKVDVFYGEMVHHEIQASSAYTLADFFNEIGGFFGLLLGASCITLIELLDCVVYNAYLQLRRSLGKRKHSAANGTEKTSSV